MKALDVHAYHGGRVLMHPLVHQAATWSSCGNLVVFALEEECVLYTLRLGQAPYSLDGDCQVITDLGIDLGYGVKASLYVVGC
jgi:hypothetical protein